MFWNERMGTRKADCLGPVVAVECPGKDGFRTWHDGCLVEIIDPATGETVGIRPGAKLVKPGALPGFEGQAKRVVDRRGVVY
jgi:phenylacetate-coenzyme A ligase PaaK-like adenylate-forming protein